MATINSASDCKVVGNNQLTGNASRYRIEGVPTVLRGAPDDNKKLFDKYSDMIATRHNQLCTYIDAHISEEIAQSVLTLYASLGWVQN